MDLTPDPKLYMIIARQQAELDFDGQKVSSSLVASYACNPGFRLAVDAAYRAGREDAARKALIEYADRHHHLDGGHGPVSTPDGWIDADAWCACGASWSEDGCPEREQLLADADQVNQPRTLSGCDGEDSPEERTGVEQADMGEVTE